ncbi:MAG: hypothetical protein M0018_02810 [Nitrospiraceae bacterium]|nr:hypothetical protein [Nitrospiraceae bacterium]
MAMRFRLWISLLIIFFLPAQAWAIIPQNYPGIYTHQLAHIFFAIALAVIIAHKIRKGYWRQRGWKHIIASFMVLLAWNVFAFLGHMAAFRMKQEYFINPGTVYNEAVRMQGPALAYVIYRMDQVFLITAMVLFYLGVRRIYKGPEKPE